MASTICYVLYATYVVGQRNTFRNIPEWNFAFATWCTSRSAELQKQEAIYKQLGVSAPLNLDILKIRSEAARSLSATCAIDRSILYRRGSRSLPTANVNYHALFLFIDAREPHSHHVSVIKNVFLARLYLLKKKKHLET